jgi:hypothetical protein
MSKLGALLVYNVLYSLVQNMSLKDVPPPPL